MRQLKITKQFTFRNEASVNLYLLEVSKYPLISSDEEVELTKKIRQNDELALQKLVNANLRFVISVAKKYQNQGLSFADLINEGNIGLVKAARRFDETRGFKFISYAVWWIRQCIMQAIAEQTRIVRLPMNRLTSINKIGKAVSFLEQHYQREPTHGELADYLDMREEQVSENIKIKNRQISFDKPLNYDHESEVSLYDRVQTDGIPSPDNELVNESVRIDLFRAMKKLDDREFDIISMSYGLNNMKVHSILEIASLLNMSGERVRQIRNVGLQKTKKILEGKNLFTA